MALSSRDDLTEDGFLGERLRIMQPARGFRSGLDAVLLAASIPAETGAAALEAGAGAGVASLCLARRVPGVRVSGLEIDPALVRLACENAARNGLADQVCVMEGSVAEPPPALRAARFDHVFANPPFLDTEESVAPAEPGRLRARQGPAGTLGQFADFCIKRARDKGTVTFIHRADKLERLLSKLDGRLGALAILPLWPRAGVAAKRVIVSGIKGSRAPLRLLPGLVLHEAEGQLTGAADAILRGGAALRLAD